MTSECKFTSKGDGFSFCETCESMGKEQHLRESCPHREVGLPGDSWEDWFPPYVFLEDTHD